MKTLLSYKEPKLIQNYRKKNQSKRNNQQMEI